MDAPGWMAATNGQPTPRTWAEKEQRKPPELLPLKERIWIVLITIEGWISSQVVVAEEIEDVGMRLVASCARNNVDRSSVGHAS